MPFNVMIQLCKITRASKLFQRNFYLPLLKPLSPKDALRRHIITGKNLLGTRIEHYIPVLEEYQDRVYRRRYIVKGLGKKRQRKKESMRYLMPFFDDEMEHHPRLQSMLSNKARGKGQCYTYYVPDKDCTLVVSHQMERAIRDKDIIDVTMAQRSEKIVVTTKDHIRITLPLVSYDGRAPFYRGEGWTRKDIEETHHHGKETMSIAKLFEAKESGVEEWELEMMRLANKRKKKMKGEGTKDWKEMMQAAAENMDWDKFEEEAKQIVEEINEPVEDEPIPMEVDSMEKTKNVNEKLKTAGEELMKKLPTMPEIPEVIKRLQDGEMQDVAEISGISLTLESSGRECFVPGQMVKSEEGELFVPGQTVTSEEGVSEYTPGFTVVMDDEPQLLPGLVMGDDPTKIMFLPGESTITEEGELQFTETEDDVVRAPTPPPIEPEVEEVELEEEENSEEEEEKRPPPPKRQKKEFIYERPKRVIEPSMGPKRRERGAKKPPVQAKAADDAAKEPVAKVKPSEPVFYDLTTQTFETDILQQEKDRVSRKNEKSSREEMTVDKLRRDLRIKSKQFSDKLRNTPKPKYEPLEPVKKSVKLEELEKSIKSGDFFTVDYKKFLQKPEIPQGVNWLDSFEYRHTFDTVGIMRHRIWKSVYSADRRH